MEAARDEPMTVACPSCGKRSRTTRRNIGKRARCTCGHRFVVAEHLSHSCPSCGMTNEAGATRCRLCNADITTGDDFQERDTTHVVEDMETQRIVDDTIYAMKHRTRWRKIGLWLLILSTPLCLYGAFVGIRYCCSGVLPSVEQVEKEMKVWAMEPVSSVLRGRPLTEYHFYRDASKSGINKSDFSLYADKEGKIIAFSSSSRWVPRVPISESLLKTTMSLFESSTNDKDPNHAAAVSSYVAQEFFDKYVGKIKLFANREGHWIDGEEEIFPTRTFTANIVRNRFAIEITMVSVYATKDDMPTESIAEQFLVIVKSRNW